MNITKRRKWLWTTLLPLLALTAFQLCASASEGIERRSPSPNEIRESKRLAREHFGDQAVDGVRALHGSHHDRDLSERSVRGKSISEAVSQLTGTAINPLLGITALGMYRYFTTPPNLQDQLPFYDQPYVWIPLIAIMVIMFFKSTICEAMPFLKVPLNALGDLVHKGGACLVLPVVLYEFAQVFAVPTADVLAAAGDFVFPTAYAAEGVSSSLSDGWMTLGWIVSSIVGAVSYAAVWVVWNVVDVAILVLPVPFLDIILKSFRHAVMALLTGAATLHPLLGLVVSLMILWICFRLAGWAFRLSVMGFVFATDILLWRKSGTINGTVGIPAFITATAGKRWKLPARQYGRLRYETDGTLYFVWRSWLVGLKHEKKLGHSNDYQGGSTLLYPMVFESAGENVLFRLPPRYRRDSLAITNALGLCGCRDVSIIRNTWKLVRQLFSTRKTADSLGK